MTTMKAITIHKYGEPELMTEEQIEIPTMGDTELLIKTHATTVNTVDIFFRKGIKVMFGLSRLSSGLFKPKRSVLGFDFAGEIVDRGKDVSGFKIGDLVFGGARTGANAEYLIAPPGAVSHIPEGITPEDAAGSVMAGLSALQGLRAGDIERGQDVMIYGASGGIGTFATQLAKHFGCHVTGVASGKNRDTVLDLGADSFIDYTTTDLTKPEKHYDLVFDAVGKFSFRHWKELVKDDGIFVTAGSPYMSMIGFLTSMIGNKFRKKQFRSFNTQYLQDDLQTLAELMEQGELRTIIDQTYTLDELAAAHRHYEQGHTVGKVIVRIE